MAEIIRGDDSRREMRVLPEIIDCKNLLESTVKKNFDPKLSRIMDQPDILNQRPDLVSFYGMEYMAIVSSGFIPTMPQFVTKDNIIDDIKNLHRHFVSTNRLTVWGECIRLYSSEYMMKGLDGDKHNNAYNIVKEYAKRVYADNGFMCAFKITPNIKCDGSGDNLERHGMIVFCTKSINGNTYFPNKEFMAYKENTLKSLMLNCCGLSGRPESIDRNVRYLDQYINYSRYEAKMRAPIYQPIVYSTGQSLIPAVSFDSYYMG